MSTDADRVGQIIAEKWRVERPLGKGSMATVYAVSNRNGARAALKVLHKTLVNDEGAIERFLAEGALANAVAHPGIVKVLDDGKTEDGCPFLVMELLDGMTLEQLRVARGGYVAPLEMMELARRLLDVLVSMHEGGIIHRDLKPTNVFLTNEGQVKLLDFGLARSLISGARAKSSVFGTVMGTPSFMSPEQALGKRDDVDAQSDVWSMGAIIFTLLTGQVVHPAPTIEHRLIAAASKRARSITTVMPTLDADVAAVIDRALAFDKKDRWPSVRGMRDALLAKAAAPADAAKADKPTGYDNDEDDAIGPFDAGEGSVSGLVAPRLPGGAAPPPPAPPAPVLPDAGAPFGTNGEDEDEGWAFDADASDDPGGATHLDLKPPPMANHASSRPAAVAGAGKPNAVAAAAARESPADVGPAPMAEVAIPDFGEIPGFPEIDDFPEAPAIEPAMPVMKGAQQAAPIAAPAHIPAPVHIPEPKPVAKAPEPAAARAPEPRGLELDLDTLLGESEALAPPGLGKPAGGGIKTATPMARKVVAAPAAAAAVAKPAASAAIPIVRVAATAKQQTPLAPPTKAAPIAQLGAPVTSQATTKDAGSQAQPASEPRQAAPQAQAQPHSAPHQTAAQPQHVAQPQQPQMPPPQSAPNQAVAQAAPIPAPSQPRFEASNPDRAASAEFVVPAAGFEPAIEVEAKMPPSVRHASTVTRTTPHVPILAQQQGPASVPQAQAAPNWTAQQHPNTLEMPVTQAAPSAPDLGGAPHIIPHADARPMAEPTMLVRQKEAAPPPRKRRWLVTVLVAIVVLALGAAGAAFYTKRLR